MIAKKKSERAIFLHGQGQAVGSVVFAEGLRDPIHLLLIVLSNVLGDNPVDLTLDHVVPLTSVLDAPLPWLASPGQVANSALITWS